MKDLLCRIRDLLAIKGKDGKYVMEAKEVAAHLGVHTNAVYQSRKSEANPDRLDKVAAVDKAREMIDGVLSGGGIDLGSVGSHNEVIARYLIDGSRYKVTIEEVEND